MAPYPPPGPAHREAGARPRQTEVEGLKSRRAHGIHRKFFGNERLLAHRQGHHSRSQRFGEPLDLDRLGSPLYVLGRVVAQTRLAAVNSRPNRERNPLGFRQLCPRAAGLSKSIRKPSVLSISSPPYWTKKSRVNRSTRALSSAARGTRVRNTCCTRRFSQRMSRPESTTAGTGLVSTASGAWRHLPAAARDDLKQIGFDRRRDTRQQPPDGPWRCRPTKGR